MYPPASFPWHTQTGLPRVSHAKFRVQHARSLQGPEKVSSGRKINELSNLRVIPHVVVLMGPRPGRRVTNLLELRLGLRSMINADSNWYLLDLLACYATFR
jgi:hypothetical protein